MPGGHPEDGLPGAGKGANDVHTEHLPDTVDAHLIDSALRADDAGVVDQRCDGAEVSVHLGEQLEHVSLDRHIRPHRQSSAPEGDTACHQVRCLDLTLPEGHAHVPAECRQQLRSRRPDAPTSSGHDCDICAHGQHSGAKESQVRSARGRQCVGETMRSDRRHRPHDGRRIDASAPGTTTVIRQIDDCVKVTRLLADSMIARSTRLSMSLARRNISKSSYGTTLRHVR